MFHLPRHDYVAKNITIIKTHALVSAVVVGAGDGDVFSLVDSAPAAKVVLKRK